MLGRICISKCMYLSRLDPSQLWYMSWMWKMDRKEDLLRRCPSFLPIFHPGHVLLEVGGERYILTITSYSSCSISLGPDTGITFHLGRRGRSSLKSFSLSYPKWKVSTMVDQSVMGESCLRRRPLTHPIGLPWYFYFHLGQFLLLSRSGGTSFP